VERAVSDHFDGQRFHNPGRAGQRSLWQVLVWVLTRRKQPWPRWIDDPPRPAPASRLASHESAITFVNHSTFLLQLGGLNILTDPVWSKRVSPLSWAGPRRVRRPGIPFDHLSPIDVVLLSHNHYDHLDLATLGRLQARDAPLIVAGLGNRRFLEPRGLPRVQEIDWWQTLPLHNGLRVTMTPALHYSRRGLFDQNRSLWGGFWLEQGGRRIYFTGDSAYGGHFGQIRATLGAPELALLPIGAYEPRWFMGRVHMNPEEAVRAHLDLGSTLSIGMHFGTFQLTDEPIDEPVRALRESLLRHHVPDGAFRVLEAGEILELPPGE
jgi:L-ascorbate metabolism protein UlaG (beta-lactamase superfamily)